MGLFEKLFMKLRLDYLEAHLITLASPSRAGSVLSIVNPLLEGSLLPHFFQSVQLRNQFWMPAYGL